MIKIVKRGKLLTTFTVELDLDGGNMLKSIEYPSVEKAINGVIKLQDAVVFIEDGYAHVFGKDGKKIASTLNRIADQEVDILASIRGKVINFQVVSEPALKPKEAKIKKRWSWKRDEKVEATATA